MSTNAIQKFEKTKSIVELAQYDFNRLAKFHKSVEFEIEQVFAVQALQNNNFLMEIAYANPESLRMAVLNVAAVGLTLNPIKKLAYLVPKNRKVQLEISYQGYKQLGVDLGAIILAKAEVVHEKDEFGFMGLTKEPHHLFKPFEDRGAIVGAYCTAKLPTGEFITDFMSIQEIHEQCRARSESYKAYLKDPQKSSPWISDESEMIKKSLVRRNYKSWPIKSEHKERIEKAMALSDEVEIEGEPIEVTPTENQERVEMLIRIDGALEFLERTTEATLEYLSRVCKRKVTKISDLSDNELKQFDKQLKGFVDKKLASEDKDEDTQAS